MKKLTSLVAILFVGVFLWVNNPDDIFSDLKGDNQTKVIETSESDQSLINIKFDTKNYPNYYAKLNDNKVDLSDKDKDLINKKGTDKKWEEYSTPDGLGRSGRVQALVTYDGALKHSKGYLKKHGGTYDGKAIQDRPPFPYNVHVSGEYQDGIYDSASEVWDGENSNNAQVEFANGNNEWIYNKSHSLAWSLGGDMETHNVTLGTRYQNVGTDREGGMAYAETKVKDAVYDNHDTKVYYDVKPVYQDKELVPRGSHVRAYSVNDDGKSVNLNVWVFNTQEGFDINYKDGSFEKTS